LPSNRPTAVACLLVLAAAGGCGGSDDEDSAETTATTPTVAATETETEAEPRETETKAETEAEPEPAEEPPATETEVAPAAPSTSPEEAPGRAGGEEPARSLALLTGHGGRITPRVVRVPAFISVRVELRSADGRMYGLRLDRRTLRAGGALGSASTLLDGLRPGAATTGRPVGGGSAVRIEATAEPGP
jgi:hypothetical protein